MEHDAGTDQPALIQDLCENASEFSVFYAIHLCEKLLAKQRTHRDQEKLEQDGIAFRPYEYYVYKARNIQAFSVEDDVMQFVINFLGLYGSDSPLPRCYHEQVAMQQRIHPLGEVPLQNFLDIFNNRFYWLYYQSWKKYRFFLQVGEEADNKVTQQISSFIGLGPQFENKPLPVNRFKLLQLSGVLSHRIRSKPGLLIMLREFFPRFNIDIEEFVRSMVKVEERPMVGSRHGQNSCRLGRHALVGSSVADYMSRICMVIGPLEFDDYLEFLPGGRSAALLRYLLDLYLNDSLEYDVKLVLNTDSISGISWRDERVKLGRSHWLGKPKAPQVEKYIRYEKYVGVS